MPEPFLRLVGALKPLKFRGTDENFYRGENYLRLSGELKAPIKAFCGSNLASVELGPEDDDTLSVFILPLVGDEGRSLFEAFRECLEEDVRGAIQDAANKISGGALVLGPNEPIDRSQEFQSELNIKKSVFSRELDGCFDTLRFLADTRDFLLKAEGWLTKKGASNEKDGPALLIEV